MIVLQRAVQWLQVEVVKIEMGKALRQSIALWIDQLEFVSLSDDHLTLALGADTDPVDAFRQRTSAVGLDGNFKPASVQGINQRAVQLQCRFATGADYI